MILIVGLGNPKEKYEETRHNVGFVLIDKIKKENSFLDFSFSKKFNAECSAGVIHEESTVLAKPMTFMNLSGKSVSKIINFYKINICQVIVVHDDIDVPLGQIKITKNKGAGGHKGVGSIIKETGSKNFTRIRIGICPEKKPSNARVFVLQKFKKNEEESLEKALHKTEQAINMIVKESAEKAASLFNAKS